MGDPRKTRKKYKGPNHPWQRIRMDEERPIKKEYGLKNKREIWKASSELKRINTQAKKLIRDRSKGMKQAEKEEKQLLERLHKYGLIAKEAHLEDVLNLNIRDILNRRLQTMVLKYGLALTSKQARQLILHGHIIVNEKKVSVPSYLISTDEQFKITLNPKSSFSSELHPERIKKAQVIESANKKKKAEENKEEVTDFTEKELEKIEKEIGVEVVV